MDGVIRIILQICLAALILYSATRCVQAPLPRPDRCLEGTTPTPDGCRAVPNWNPWTRDASVSEMEPPADAGAAVDAGEVDAGTNTSTVPPDAGVEPEELEGLTGSWGLRTVNAQIVNNEFVGQEVVDTVVLSLVDILHVGDRVDMTTRVCSIVSSTYGDMTTTFDAEFIAGLDADRTVATVSAMEPGGAFVPAPRTRLIAWTAQDPQNEAVPVNDNDPRVYDADSDGEVGASLHVSGAVNGDLYIVQRTTIRLEGTVESWSRITGTSRTDIEREEIGTSNRILRASETTRRPHPNPDRSPFEMVRVPRSMDCGALEQILNPTP